MESKNYTYLHIIFHLKFLQILRGNFPHPHIDFENN